MKLRDCDQIKSPQAYKVCKGKCYLGLVLYRLDLRCVLDILEKL